MSAWVPAGAPAQFERTDQGVDFKTTPGGPIIAPYPGVVQVARANPGGFGTHYPTITFSAGPWKGQTWYIGHTLALKTGPVSAGDVISHTGTGSESWMGNAKGIPGHAEIGRLGAGGTYPGMTAGAAIKSLVLGGQGAAVAASSSTSTGDSSSPNAIDFATDPVGAIVQGLLGPIEQQGVRMLLYLVLIGGGVALAVMGVLRAAGTKPKGDLVATA